jgi:hypothetical protein
MDLIHRAGQGPSRLLHLKKLCAPLRPSATAAGALVGDV